MLVGCRTGPSSSLPIVELAATASTTPLPASQAIAIDWVAALGSFLTGGSCGGNSRDPGSGRPARQRGADGFVAASTILGGKHEGIPKVRPWRDLGRPWLRSISPDQANARHANRHPVRHPPRCDRVETCAGPRG